MVSQVLDILRSVVLCGIEPDKHRLAMMVKDTLAGNAHSTQAHLIVGPGMAKQLAYARLQLLSERSYLLLYEGIQRLGRFDHLPQHQLAVPGGLAFAEYAPEKGADKRVQPLFCRSRIAQAEVWGIFLREAAVRIVEDCGVQALLVAKVVVHRSDVGLRPLADFPHGGSAEAALRKNLASGFQ